MRMWRQVNSPSILEISSSKNTDTKSAKPLLSNQQDLNSIINLLESQDLNSETRDSSRMNPFSNDLQLQKLQQLQESYQLYERLQMKHEFLYNLRMYTMMLISLGDMVKLRELLLEYKFMTTWEEEVLIDNPKSGFKMSADGAYNNLMNLMANQDDEDDPNSSSNPVGGEKSKVIYKDKHVQICGCMSKKEVF